MQVKTLTTSALGTRVLDESDWSNPIEVSISESVHRQLFDGTEADDARMSRDIESSSSVPVPTDISTRVISPTSIGLSWKLSNERHGQYTSTPPIFGLFTFFTDLLEFKRF